MIAYHAIPTSLTPPPEASGPRTPCAPPRTPSAPDPDTLPLAEWLAWWRADQVKTLRLTAHPGGYAIDGYPHVARRYHLRDGRTGWTMVSDDPAALAWFDKLFGDAQGRLAL